MATDNMDEDDDIIRPLPKRPPAESPPSLSASQPRPQGEDEQPRQPGHGSPAAGPLRQTPTGDLVPATPDLGLDINLILGLLGGIAPGNQIPSKVAGWLDGLEPSDALFHARDLGKMLDSTGEVERVRAIASLLPQLWDRASAVPGQQLDIARRQVELQEFVDNYNRQRNTDITLYPYRERGLIAEASGKATVAELSKGIQERNARLADKENQLGVQVKGADVELARDTSLGDLQLRRREAEQKFDLAQQILVQTGPLNDRRARNAVGRAETALYRDETRVQREKVGSRVHRWWPIAMAVCAAIAAIVVLTIVLAS